MDWCVNQLNYLLLGASINLGTNISEINHIQHNPTSIFRPWSQRTHFRSRKNRTGHSEKLWNYVPQWKVAPLRIEEIDTYCVFDITQFYLNFAQNDQIWFQYLPKKKFKSNFGNRKCPIAIPIFSSDTMIISKSNSSWLEIQRSYIGRGQKFKIRVNNPSYDII